MPRVLAGLDALHEAGLGYVTLGPVEHDALRRRGPAHQAGGRAGPARDRPRPLHPRRADDRPALRRYRPAAGDPPSPGGPRSYRRGDRAPARRDRLGRLGDRPGPRRRRGGGRVVAMGPPADIAHAAENRLLPPGRARVGPARPAGPPGCCRPAGNKSKTVFDGSLAGR